MTEFSSRRDYSRGELDESSVAADPFVQFASWYDDAVASGEVLEPNAMVLSTATASASPASRVVLLRRVDSDGFVFFTNYDSRKGLELTRNPHAALLFYWERFERQIRIEGEVTRIAAEESDIYFETRPYMSRIGALASAQSSELDGRAQLETLIKQLIARYPDGSAIPRPANWGGYQVRPSQFEFWQGRASRLHDRLRYQRNGEAWAIKRLAP